MGDERQLEAEQRLVGALYPAGGEAQRLADPRQALQGRALGGYVGQFAQLAQSHGDVVVLADHGQAGRAAIHLLGLMHQGEAFDDALAPALAGVEIEQQGFLAPLGQCLLAIQFPVTEPDPLLQHLLQFRIALQDQPDGLFRDHQQHHLGLGDHRGGLLLAQQTGLFAEHLTLPQGRQRVLGIVLGAHHPHPALAHHIEPAVLPLVLGEDGAALVHPLDADAADDLFQLITLDLAAQIEQPGDETAGGVDRHIVGDEALGIRIACQDRLEHLMRKIQQFGLGGGPDGGLMAVALEHRDLGEHLPLLAHPHADLLAPLLHEHAHRTLLDHIEAFARVARIAHGVAEIEAERSWPGRRSAPAPPP